MQLTTPQTNNPLKAGGLASLAGHLADYGRNGDTYIVHAAEGETVIPMEILDSNPQLKQMLFNQMRNMGIEPERYIVGNELNSINPVTGQPEFFLKKIGKGLKKALKKLAPLIGFAAGSMIKSKMIPGMEMIGPGVGTALATKLAGGSTGKALAYGGLGALAGGLGSRYLQSQPIGGQTGVVPSGIPTIGRDQTLASAFSDKYLGGAQMPALMRGKFGSGSTPTGAVSPPQIDYSSITDPTTLQGIVDIEKNATQLGIPRNQTNQMINNYVANAGRRKGGFLPNIHPALKLAGLGGLGYLAMKEGKRDDVDLSRLKSALDAEREMGTQTGFDLMAENPSQYGFDPRSFVPFGDLSLLPPDVLAEAIRNFGPAVNAAKGGYIDVVKADQGGEIVGPGTGTSDSIPAMLSDGEFVMTANAVKGAGGGDRREGARKMYQMMKRFEGAQGGLARAY
jgi:hypothetical protein